MREYLSINSIILFVLAILLIAWGSWIIYSTRTYTFGGGLYLIGVGNLMFGLTRGFIDVSPSGILLFRIGLGAYVLGVLAVGYSMRGFI